MVKTNSDLSRLKVFFIGLTLLLFLGGITLVATKDLYSVISGLDSGVRLIELNVYGLVIPLLGIGLLIWIFSAFVTALIYGKKVNAIWRRSTEQLFHRLIGVFMALSLIFAIAMYQWLDSEFKARGYIYCEGESSLSAMGKHEVYMKPVCDNVYYEANL